MVLYLENHMTKDNMLNPLFENIQIGIGTWQWGDRIYWGYGIDYQEEDIMLAIKACVQYGLRFFDTAEVYGMGKSETLLGKGLLQTKESVMVASKFMPFPWRLKRSNLLSALKNSLQRLNLNCIDLYQIHYPFPPINIETWMEGMVDAHQAGLIREIGVSNYNRDQLQCAFDTLIHHGIRLASIQIEYNLLNRSVEKSGLLRLCEQLGIACIAYSPLAQGILTGKYHPDHIPKGIRGRRYSQDLINKTQGLINAMKQIGSDHSGKNCTQVAINWAVNKGTIPIPGIKNAYQVEDISGALGWKLDGDEMQLLDDLSDQYISGNNP